MAQVSLTKCGRVSVVGADKWADPESGLSVKGHLLFEHPPWWHDVKHLIIPGTFFTKPYVDTDPSGTYITIVTS